MKKVNLAVTAAALLSIGTVGSVEARASRSLSDQDAVRLSYAALQVKAGDFGIASAAQELKVRQVRHDFLKHTHVRMDQVYKGVPVFGEQLVTHFNRQGQLYLVSGTFAPSIDLSVRPKISPSRALDLALADFAHEVSEAPSVKLVVLAQEVDQPVLAYHLELKDLDGAEPMARVYFVDAHTGMIAWDYDNLQTATAEGTGNSLYSGEVPLTTNSGPGGFAMMDPSRGGLETTDLNQGTAGNGVTYIDADNSWGNGTMSDRATEGVDAHFGAAMTWDYYSDNYGRNGLRGDGKGNLSRTHYGVAYVNAFWDDTCFCMTYGDGDGVQSSALVTVDVAGHEMTHGLTSVTAGLIYTGQSGGLNESMSDIFGTAVEFYAAANGGEGVPDYWVGEDCWTPPRPNDALRYMDEPTRDGRSIDHASRYLPVMDVHYSSGVSNNVFYLASEGGTNKTSNTTVQGIGREKAEAIFYLALTEYMTPWTRWSQARGYTVQAATDLYGQPEADGMASAWQACGVR